MSDADKPLNKKDQKCLDEKRGEGTGKDYVPFIKVGEFSSSGESVRVKSATVCNGQLNLETVLGTFQ